MLIRRSATNVTRARGLEAMAAHEVVRPIVEFQLGTCLLGL
jgi:hypothetical protein